MSCRSSSSGTRLQKESEILFINYFRCRGTLQCVPTAIMWLLFRSFELFAEFVNFLAHGIESLANLFGHPANPSISFPASDFASLKTTLVPASTSRPSHTKLCLTLSAADLSSWPAFLDSFLVQDSEAFQQFEVFGKDPDYKYGVSNRAMPSRRRAGIARPLTSSIVTGWAPFRFVSTHCSSRWASSAS